MRLNAYVLLGDPAWLRTSVASYYPYVSRIIASYDENGFGWTGAPIRVEESLRALAAVDVDKKVVFVPGRYSDSSRHAMELDTEQRQEALDAASEGADWILQVDTDEVIPDWPLYAERLQDVSSRGLTALWYPQRVLRARLTNSWFFEEVGSKFRSVEGHPGPTAVRPGARLLHARQDDSERLLLGYGRGPLQVPKRKAIVHLSWVRTIDNMFSKARWSGHASDFDWSGPLGDWLTAQAHPLRFMPRTALRRASVRWRPAFIRGDWADDFAPFAGARASRAAATRVLAQGRQVHPGEPSLTGS